MALDHKQLAELKDLIERRRAALAVEVRVDVARAREETFGALAGPVPDSGDKASADLLSDLDQAEVTRDLGELRALDAALERIEDGSYGRCAGCGADIDPARLRVQPAAERCTACQSVHEKTHAHPGEPKL